jgi:uncharacterized protein involved in type VI secretion and phage assembly
MGLLNELLSDDYEEQARISGITTGIVKENWNKEHQGMVKVEMYLGEQGKNVTGWIPVMSSYAGNGCGNYWLPEVGQEVVIGFHFGERNCPIVLGCLWNNKNKLPEKVANEKNTIKKFKTKGGCEVIFDDEKSKEKITVITPGKLSFTIEDEKKQIKIKDEKGENSIEMDCEKGNITFQAKKKMEFKIGKDAAITLEDSGIKLKSKSITQEAQQKVSVSGQSVNLDAKSNVGIAAKANVNIEGKAGAKVNSSGLLEVKGSMVKIN